MGSGLFDEYPRLKLILGHLGEGLPFSIWRVDHRIAKGGRPTKSKLPMAYYLRENFYVTTSGSSRVGPRVGRQQFFCTDGAVALYEGTE